MTNLNNYGGNYYKQRLFNKGTFPEKKEEDITKADISKARMEKWEKFSMNPQTEEAIEHELLYNPDDVCVSYICRYSKLSEEFIEKMIVLTSGLIGPRNYKSDYDKVKELCEAKYSGDTEKKVKLLVEARMNEVGRTLIEKECTGADVRDRVDWFYIAYYQKLSEPFMRKYLHVLPKQNLLATQVLTDEFREELIGVDSQADNKATNSEIINDITKSVEVYMDVPDDEIDEVEPITVKETPTTKSKKKTTSSKTTTAKKAAAKPKTTVKSVKKEPKKQEKSED
jgi:hypothetical protein